MKLYLLALACLLLPKVAVGRTWQIYDLSGRLTRTLVDARVPAGRHAVVRNANDAAGRPVPSGICFVMLDAQRGSRVMRATLIR